MKTTNKKLTKFIASLDEKNTTGNIEELAKTLIEDGINVEHVSEMLGYINASADVSLEELQNRYKSKGLHIEEDRKVGI
jgi:chromosome segregation and condensation protein ScpB